LLPVRLAVNLPFAPDIAPVGCGTSSPAFKTEWNSTGAIRVLPAAIAASVSPATQNAARSTSFFLTESSLFAKTYSLAVIFALRSVSVR
jgi:hypothetical protein